MTRPKIDFDPEFRSLCPKLSHDEKAKLLESLQKEGCRDALVLWKGQHLLLDGHNRHDLCTKHQISFKTVQMEFADRDAAKQWIVSNQLSRRNLTPEATSYLRGRRYNAEKKPGSPGRPKKGDQTAHLKTHERLAEDYKVGAATIRRDGRFAIAVDAIAENCGGSKARELILARDSGLGRGAIVRLSKLTATQQQAFLDELKATGKPPKKPKTGGRRTTITVTAKRKDFALAVVKRFGGADALEMAKAIVEAAKEAAKAAKNGDGKG